MADDTTAIGVLEDAMRDAALSLAQVLGLEDLTGPSIDRDQVPAAVWNAADAALKFLLVGLGTVEAEPGEFDETELRRFLEARQGARDAG